MNILVICLGKPSDCFLASSTIKGLSKEYVNSAIYCLTSCQESNQIFSFCKGVRNSYVLEKASDEFFKKEFDKIINLSVFYDAKDEQYLKGKIDAKFIEPTSDMYKVLSGETKTNKNIFQVYYNMAGLKWMGEGFDIKYYPKNKCNNNRTGVSIANVNLRTYIIDKLNLDHSKIWYIPFRRNIFKRIDEANRCRQIVTDDFMMLNIAISLRKEVHFLKTIDYPTKIEMFGSGMVYNVPVNILQSI